MRYFRLAKLLTRTDQNLVKFVYVVCPFFFILTIFKPRTCLKKLYLTFNEIVSDLCYFHFHPCYLKKKLIHGVIRPFSPFLGKLEAQEFSQ